MGATTTHTTADARDYVRRIWLWPALALSTTFFFDRLRYHPYGWHIPPRSEATRGMPDIGAAYGWPIFVRKRCTASLWRAREWDGGQKKSPTASAVRLRGPPPEPKPRRRVA